MIVCKDSNIKKAVLLPSAKVKLVLNIAEIFDNRFILNRVIKIKSVKWKRRKDSR